MQQLLTWQTQSLLEVKKIEMKDSQATGRVHCKSQAHLPTEMRQMLDQGGPVGTMRMLHLKGSSYPAPVDFCLMGVWDPGHRLFKFKCKKDFQTFHVEFSHI